MKKSESKSRISSSIAPRNRIPSLSHAHLSRLYSAHFLHFSPFLIPPPLPLPFIPRVGATYCSLGNRVSPPPPRISHLRDFFSLPLSPFSRGFPPCSLSNFREITPMQNFLDREQRRTQARMKRVAFIEPREVKSSL